MALDQPKPVGTATLSNWQEIRVNKLSEGPLVIGGTITYQYPRGNPGGQVHQISRTIEWEISPSAKSSLADLVPEILAAINADIVAEAPEPEPDPE